MPKPPTGARAERVRAIQARCRSTKANPSASGTRGGRVRMTAPERASTLSSMRLARGERRMMTGSRSGLWFENGDHMIFEIARLALGHGAAADGDSGPVHAFGIAGHQRVPVRQVPAFGYEAIGAGLRHPAQLPHILEGQDDAVGHQPLALRVALAAAEMKVE